MASASCPLCERLKQLDAVPAGDVVWQFPHSVALLGPWQYYTGYCLLIARVHHAELHEMSTPARAAFFEEMVTLAHAIDTAFQPRKMNYELLGNQVPHLHWHLFPRRADDPEMLKAVWLALDRAECDEAEKTRLQGAPLSRPEISSRLRSILEQGKAPSA